MQLMPATASRFGLEGSEVFEPEKNLDAGARYLSWLTRRFEGRLAWVLAAYNAGEGTVDRYSGVPPTKRPATTCAVSTKSSAWPPTGSSPPVERRMSYRRGAPLQLGHQSQVIRRPNLRKLRQWIRAEQLDVPSGPGLLPTPQEDTVEPGAFVLPPSAETSFD